MITQYLLIFIAKYLVYVMLLGSMVIPFYKGRIYFFRIFVSTTIAWSIAQLIQGIAFTPRPFVINGISPLITVGSDEGSFPSGHTSAVFALGFTVFSANRWLGILYFLLGFMVGMARIILSVHYIADIFGGILLGFMVSFLSRKIIK